MIPNEAEFLEALRRVVAAFEQLGIDYAVAGSYASSIYGEARATRDVDLIAAVPGRLARALIEALGPGFYADEGQILAASQNQGQFNLIHVASMSKVDVYVVWRTDFGRSQLERKKRVQVGFGEPLNLSVISPEDIILAKLNWYREGGEISDRQWRDILGVIRVQGQALDRVYLRKWGEQLGLAELLGRAFEESGLSSDA